MKLVSTNNFQIAINEYGDNTSNKFCILMPGRLDTKDYVNFVSHGNFLADLGYHVIAIDPPYTWESPGPIENYTTSTYIQAVSELIELFGNKPTLLLGHSRGGATAMLTSTQSPHIKTLVVINSSFGPPSPPDKNKLIDGCLPESRDIPPGSKRTKEQIGFMLPMTYFEDGDKHDPVSALKSFNGPKLVIHATDDEFVSTEKAKAVFDDLANPKTYLEVNCAHDYRLFPDVIDQINKTLEEFLKSVF